MNDYSCTSRLTNYSEHKHTTRHKSQVELTEPVLNCSEGGTFGRNWKCAKTAGPKLECHIKVYDLSVNRSLVLSVCPWCRRGRAHGKKLLEPTSLGDLLWVLTDLSYNN